MARDRIATNKDSFAKEHEHRTEKINKSIADMDKAEKSRKASRIFGWLMAAVAVIVAVVACVATGGLAIGPLVGALVAVGLQIASVACCALQVGISLRIMGKQTSAFNTQMQNGRQGRAEHAHAAHERAEELPCATPSRSDGSPAQAPCAPARGAFAF